MVWLFVELLWLQAWWLFGSHPPSLSTQWKEGEWSNPCVKIIAANFPTFDHENTSSGDKCEKQIYLNNPINIQSNQCSVWFPSSFSRRKRIQEMLESGFPNPWSFLHKYWIDLSQTIHQEQAIKRSGFAANSLIHAFTFRVLFLSFDLQNVPTN